jgi:hypothetical protein
LAQNATYDDLVIAHDLFGIGVGRRIARDSLRGAWVAIGRLRRAVAICARIRGAYTYDENGIADDDFVIGLVMVRARLVPPSAGGAAAALTPRVAGA